MSKVKLQEARELIQQTRYDEARIILKQINHPKAREWLDKLDEIAPEKSRSTARAVRRTQPQQKITDSSSKMKLFVGIGVLLVITVVVILASVLLLTGGSSSPLNQSFAYSGITVSFPTGWTAEGGGFGTVTLASVTEEEGNFDDIVSFLLDGNRVVSISPKVNALSEASLIEVTQEQRAEADAGMALGETELLRIGNRSAATYSVTGTGINARVYIVNVEDDDALVIFGLALDIEGFRPLLEDIIESVIVEHDQLIDVDRVLAEIGLSSTLSVYCERIGALSEAQCDVWSDRVVMDQFDEASQCDSFYDWITERSSFSRCLLDAGISALHTEAIPSQDREYSDSDITLVVALSLYCEGNQSEDYCDVWTWYTFNTNSSVIQTCASSFDIINQYQRFNECLAQSNIVPGQVE